LVLAVGVGAAAGWNYGDVFSGIFGSRDGEIFEIPNTIRPEMRSIANPVSGTHNSADDITVLGMAGDGKALYMVLEVKGFNPRLNHNLDLFDFTASATGESLMRTMNDGELLGDFHIDYSSNMYIRSQTRRSAVIAVGFDFGNFELNESGWLSFLFYDVRQYSPAEYERDDIIFFEVFIDVDFSQGERVFLELNDVANVTKLAFADESLVPVLLTSIELTPIALRLTYDIDDNDEYADVMRSVKITFNNGDVVNTRDCGSLIHGSGGAVQCSDTFGWGDATVNMHFSAPFDLSEVYSVTVGDFEIVLG
jgi:hypothetical protein